MVDLYRERDFAWSEDGPLFNSQLGAFVLSFPLK